MRPIDVLILTCNAASSLARCLATVRRHTPEPHRIIVVDNGSRDDTNRLLKRHPAIQVVRLHANLGIPEGLNRGLSACRSDLVAKLDDDAVVGPGWMHLLAAPFARDARLAVTGCRILRRDGTLEAADGLPGDFAYPEGPLQNLEPLETDRGQRRYTRRCAAVSGACWIMRRSAALALGGFDRRLPCLEDIDFCLRAREAGWHVLFVGRLAIRHENLARWRPLEGTGLHRFRTKWGQLDRVSLSGLAAPERAAEQARRLAAQGAWRPALAALKRAARGPRPIDRRLLGLSLLAVSRPLPAVRALRKAVRLNPLDLPAREALISALETLGRSQAAHREAGRLLDVLTGRLRFQITPR